MCIVLQSCLLFELHSSNLGRVRIARGLRGSTPSCCHSPLPSSSSVMLLGRRGLREPSQFLLYLKFSSRRGHLASLKCKKTFQQLGLCLDHTQGAYSILRDPLVGGEPPPKNPPQLAAFGPRCCSPPSSFFTILALSLVYTT